VRRERYAVCIGFRAEEVDAWRLAHLDRCLASLTRGTSAPVVVCDLGSDDSVFAQLAGITDEREAYLLAEGGDEWSRSRALNAAAWVVCRGELAERVLLVPDWLIFTDADTFFPRDWFAAAEWAMGDGATRWPPAIVGLTPSRDIPEWAMPLGDKLLSYLDEELRLLTTPHPPEGQGAAMVVPRAWFERVGGFDEYYRGWGGEDTDLVFRAQWDGLHVEWLPSFVCHQWHSRAAAPELWAKVLANRTYLAEREAEAAAGRPRVVRNGKAARK
jgi:hypothetical protein